VRGDRIPRAQRNRNTETLVRGEAAALGQFSGSGENHLRGVLRALWCLSGVKQEEQWTGRADSGAGKPRGKSIP
jgi:hypothetical protein